jgi:hypothetical protein
MIRIIRMIRIRKLIRASRYLLELPEPSVVFDRICRDTGDTLSAAADAVSFEVC